MGNTHEQNRWYPLRVTYGRELKLKDRLDKLQLASFIPMTYKQIEKDGRRRRALVPAINNLCFVHATRCAIDDLRSQLKETIPFHYIWDRATSLPIVVPDKADVSPLLKSGQKVRVIAGPFAGIEGKVVRIRKAKRVMVELPEMLAVATTYIRPEWLETIKE